jgi:hypothetical protein
MATMADSLVQQLTGTNALSQLSKDIGADESTTSNAVSTAIPLLMTALARNASDPDGAASLHNALEKDHDGGVLDDIPSYLANPNVDDGNGILRHTLGGQQQAVEQSLAGSTGLDPAMIAKLLAMAAPLVLGMLAKQQKQGGLDNNGLTDMLNNEKKANASANPDMMDMLSGMLDMNKDGGFMDDLSRLAGNLFKRKPANSG